MPLAQPFSPGDVRLNEGNAIVELDGSEVDWGCNGDVVRTGKMETRSDYFSSEKGLYRSA